MKQMFVVSKPDFQRQAEEIVDTHFESGFTTRTTLKAWIQTALEEAWDKATRAETYRCDNLFKKMKTEPVEKFLDQEREIAKLQSDVVSLDHKHGVYVEACDRQVKEIDELKRKLKNYEENSAYGT